MTPEDHGNRRTVPTGSSRWHTILPHAVGLTWVIGSALLVLLPALHHGLSLGPYDLLSKSGLTKATGASVRNSTTGDQIAEMIPWSSLAWLQVHQGHLPLWNPFNGLGLPLAFNWQSSVFSLPALVGYAFPLHLAYTVQIIVTMVIAGTGAYALGRVLGLGAIGCATAGTVFELSGSFMGWLGYPHASVMAWAGWLLALSILIVRGNHRWRNIALFALVAALAIYAGQPEIFTMLVVSSVIVVVTMVIVNARSSQSNGSGMRSLIDLMIAILAGLGLGAPILLPGLQVLSASTRNSGALVAKTEVGKSLPPHDLLHLLVQGYNGLPIAGSNVFGDTVYFDTAAYLGVIAIALAVLGLVRRWRRPECAALGILAVLTTLAVFAPPVEALFIRLPLIQTIDWHRELMVVGLCVAVLAGVGMDVVVRGEVRRTTTAVLGGILASGLVLLLLLLLVGSSGLSRVDATLRRQSLIWPLATTGLALAAVLLLAVWSTKKKTAPLPGARGLAPGQITGGFLLVLETAFLIASGALLWPSSATGVSPSPQVSALVRSVGDATVGFGALTCFDGPSTTALGILPETNILYGVHEFDFYDPILPKGYFRSWSGVSRSGPGVPIFNSFCPAITTADQARRFGVEYVLVSRGAVGPVGAVYDRQIGDEDLYRIPNSSVATLTPAPAMSRLPSVDSPGTPVAVSHPTPSAWKMTTSSPTDQVLRLRLTNVPGWHATIDGHPLDTEPYAQVMIQARIPPGRHLIELNYWPPLFTLGLIVAGGCVILLAAAWLSSAYRHHSSESAPVRPGDLPPAVDVRTAATNSQDLPPPTY